jgi:hypothetical protein
VEGGSERGLEPPWESCVSFFFPLGAAESKG